MYLAMKKPTFYSIKTDLKWKKMFATAKYWKRVTELNKFKRRESVSCIRKRQQSKKSRIAVKHIAIYFQRVLK